jgi:hypothetical protein
VIIKQAKAIGLKPDAGDGWDDTVVNQAGDNGRMFSAGALPRGHGRKFRLSRPF